MGATKRAHSKVPKLLGSLAGNEFTFDDCLVAPGRLTRFTEREIDLTTHLTHEIKLHYPLASASMDTVAESEMCIKLALIGAIGALHYNFGPDLDENIRRQKEEAEKVKRYQQGFISNPFTLAPNSLVDEAAAMRIARGFGTVPITADGKPNGRLVGMLDEDDYSMRPHRGMPVRDRMVKIGHRGMSGRYYTKVTWDQLKKHGRNPLDVANDILLESHQSGLPVVDAKGNLKYLVTRTDIEKGENYPNATKDNDGQLRVLAAVETWRDKALKRMEALEKVVDGFVIDSAHGFF